MRFIFASFFLIVAIPFAPSPISCFVKTKQEAGSYFLTNPIDIFEMGDQPMVNGGAVVTATTTSSSSNGHHRGGGDSSPRGLPNRTLSGGRPTNGAGIQRRASEPALVLTVDDGHDHDDVTTSLLGAPASSSSSSSTVTASSSLDDHLGSAGSNYKQSCGGHRGVGGRVNALRRAKSMTHKNKSMYDFGSIKTLLSGAVPCKWGHLPNLVGYFWPR
jgi:hypothetical protein